MPVPEVFCLGPFGVIWSFPIVNTVEPLCSLVKRSNFLPGNLPLGTPRRILGLF